MINEIFYSIQGEGLLTGVPSVFVRFAGCNLRCKWCDTPYAAWEAEGKERSVDEIMARVESYPSMHCVFTGGEPMLARERHELTERLNRAGKHITIETNGTVSPDGIFCDLASVSPKLSNSRPDRLEHPEWRERHEKARIQIDVLREWIDRYDYQLKFVVLSEQDADEIVALLTELKRDIPPERVLLMPEGADQETVKSRAKLVVELCKQYGYCYARRLHIELFGNRRGV